jgi:hypothetical protein
MERAKQLTAIGRLTVNFTLLDSTIDAYIAIILWPRRPAMVGAVIEGLNFNTKLDKLRKLVRIYAKAFPSFPAEALPQIEATLTDIGKVAEERNKLIHFRIEADSTSGQPIFVSPKTGGRIDSSSESIEKLVERVKSLAGKLHELLTVALRPPPAQG